MTDRVHRPGPPATPPDITHHTLLESQWLLGASGCHQYESSCPYIY